MFFTAKNSAQRGQVEQVAFIRAHDQAHVRHEQHHHELQAAAKRALRHAVANYEREKIGAEYSENTADGGADQAFKAYPELSPLKYYDCEAEKSTYSRVQPGMQPEWMNQ